MHCVAWKVTIILIMPFVNLIHTGNRNFGFKRFKILLNMKVTFDHLKWRNFSNN